MLGRMMAAAAAVPLTAAPQTADADEDSRAAREAFKNASEQVAKVALPVAAEPAFTFKA
jgi:hypothetical protein